MAVVSIYSIPDVLYSKLHTTTVSMSESNGTICIEPVISDNMPVPQTKKSSAYGCLSKYANPALMEQEKGAWGLATVNVS
ncbi:MAG: hypothetical protein FWB85_03245 [Chitinispirillia bacterium]|nr:hypothetical protein [Chitinispirillia bacterium]MCL2241393.1 hypothetical protein [Chitinispirillia bacterium]